MTMPESLHALPFVTGHGTENDFVFFADPEGRRGLDADMARWLCDRRAGIGGDGAIRAVRCAFLDEDVARQARAEGAEWFMDYRNADGSVAEMCGNGARVFAAYLAAQGLIPELGAEPMLIGTRGGVRRLWREGENFAVDMGEWTQWHDESLRAGVYTGVTAPGLPEERYGIGLDVPNPHVVIFVDDESMLAGLDLSSAPLLEPLPSHGANVEFVAGRPSPSSEFGSLSMRVFERGVGETRSCGTGVCAAALASWLQARGASGGGAPVTWRVHVPGGDLEVRIDPATSVVLVGPAVLVAEGVLL